MAEEKDKTAEAPSSERKSDAQMAREYEAARLEQGTIPFPKIDFSMFLFSLNSSVLVHMGVLDDPAAGKKSKNLTAAKQTIDILGMLEEKTRGNLTDQERDMLRHILYDLRMIYVREAG
ncbi:DUF1844 domain-containing protein [Desulfococcus sp.]|uniref:DUF1844 domain-containing protein n=1 Tax=Desulfococcus sp. TaxID=2025834 RepID=UPI0035941DC7